MLHDHVDVRRIDADARPHRRRQRDALQIFALCRRRLRLDDAVTSACAFAISELVANDALPTGAWMMPVLSTRNSTLPALISLTAFEMSTVTVPVFGLGIRPRGPSTFPSLPTARIMSG